MKSHTIAFDEATALSQRKAVVKSFFEVAKIAYSPDSRTSKQICFLHIYPRWIKYGCAYYLSSGFPSDYEIDTCTKITFFYYC